MKSIKRIIIIAPLIFILQVFFFSYTSAFSAFDEDYSEYFLTPDDTPVPIDLQAALDFEAYQIANSIPTSSQKRALENKGFTSVENYSYFFSVHQDDTNRRRLIEHSTTNASNHTFDIYLISDTSPAYEDEDYVVYEALVCSRYVVSVDSNSTLSDPLSWTLGIATNGNKDWFIYNKKLGTCFHRQTSEVPTDLSAPIFDSLRTPRYIYYQDCSIPDFPYADGVNHGSGGGLDVSVFFRPSLSGEVDRMLTDSDGTKSMVSQMRMTVINNSSFPIQYKMYIVKKNQTTSRPFDASGGKASHYQVYDDDPVFVYYSNEWVYSPNIDNSADWYNGIPQKQNKASEWHYLDNGGSVAVMFNYSQINLIENEEYICYVEAVSNDYGIASKMFVSQATSEAAYPEFKHIFSDNIQVVYKSEFSMLHYSDVKYDPSDSSNGVLPYSSYADGQSYDFSYNAKETEDGDIDYESKNVYDDDNSWWNNSYNPNGSYYPSSSSSGSGSFNSLSSTISGFFSLVNTTLSYFPSSTLSVFTLGLTSIVIIGFIKAVFK